MYVLVICDLAHTKEIASDAQNIEEVNEGQMLKGACDIIVRMLQLQDSKYAYPIIRYLNGVT